MSSKTENQKQSIPPQTAIPFITFDPKTKKFIINEEAKRILSKSENKQIGILSLVGKYRTGKSFLLNRVLIEKKSSKGFDVGPTIRPCTKGIWLWSSPLMISNKNCPTSFPAYLIDTEGLGAYDEEINHDSKIFLIAILISSLFIYNSFGTIDEVALNNLSLILNLSKSLKLRNNSNVLNSKESDDKEMAKYFPSLFWLLRDFALKLEDSDGNVITAKQYLENALMEQKGSTESIEEKNLVRKMIKTYFLERDCFPLVRPVENENDLQNLMNLPEDKIRPEFIKQSTMLRNKIYMKIKPKNFNGKILSGQMLVDLVESVVNAINEGAIPVIENSWNYIASNECLKSIRENTEYFKKSIMEYQKENLTRPDFFNELQKYSQSLIEEIIAKFRDENEKRFDDVNEYVHKLKLSLNQEFKKLNEENISLIKDKYILDLDKEIDNLIKDKEELVKVNYINFISNLLQIKYRLDSTIPSFILKDQISYEKIIETIKKYIEEYFVKSRNSIEQEIQNLKMEYQFLESKYNNLNDEYTKDKNEFKQTVNNYNDMLIESKLRIKTYEEKIKNFENEKKTLKETNERTIKANNKSMEEKIEKMNMEINKLKSDIKAKEEDLLVYKLNDEKVMALNTQKINFLEKELSQWKERYNTQSKELSENKSQIIGLNSDLDKLKNENKSLKNKAEIGGMLKIDENFRGSANNFFSGTSGGNLSGNLGAASSKILMELLNGQNYIKDYIKEVMDKTNELVQNNKNIYENNQNISQFLRGFKGLSNNISSNNSVSNSMSVNNNFNSNKDLLNIYNKKDNVLANNYNTQPQAKSVLLDENMHKNQENTQKMVHHTKYNSIDKNKIQSKNMNLNSINNNYNTTNVNINNNNSNTNSNNFLDIKVSNSVLKKDITGKPFLDYICDVKNGNESFTLNKKFGHFIMLHKALKGLFKDTIKLPDGGNLFMSINDMKQNAFHENKLSQLDKYINDLMKIEQIKTSVPFRNFFELDEVHEQNMNNKIRKNKTMMEKKKYDTKYTNNTGNAYQKNANDNNNDLMNFK